MTAKEIIDVSKCPFFDEWKHCTLCKEFAKIQNRHLLIEADLRCEEQPIELCYYKQLARKTQECEELLKENQQLRNSLSNSLMFKFTSQENETNRYREALEEIEEVIKTPCAEDCVYYELSRCYDCIKTSILDIINKAKAGNNENT